MDFKYDSKLMHDLIDATERRMEEVRVSYDKIKKFSESIEKNLWDDSKRQKFDAFFQDVFENLQGALRKAEQYLDTLKMRVVELEGN